MSIFEYKAIDANGKEGVGLIEGDTQKSVRQLLQSQHLTVLEISQSKRKINQERSWFGATLSLTDITLFTRQLASLLQATMPIDEALQTIASHNPKKHVKKRFNKYVRLLSREKVWRTLCKSTPKNYRLILLQL